MSDNEPWSDQWKRQALKANDLDAAASLLENTRTSVLSQKKLALGDIADNKAEKIVKASQEWQEFNEEMVETRRQANAAKVEAEWMRMKYYESQGERADERVMARM